jgi:hypothetical protein
MPKVKKSTVLVVDKQKYKFLMDKIRQEDEKKLIYIQPDDIAKKGKHKGYSFSDIYKFCPEYLEFAIEFWNNFIIDLDKFKALPKPTPYIKKYPVEFRGKVIENHYFKPKESSIPHAFELLSLGGVINEIDYSFPERIIRIQNEKIQGVYTVPPYQYMDEKLISIEQMTTELESLQPENLICWHCKGSRKTGCLKGHTDCNKFEWVDRNNV